MDGSKSGTNGDTNGEENVESPSIRSVTSPNSFRNFVLPLIWTVNDFNLTIKRKNFDTL